MYPFKKRAASTRSKIPSYLWRDVLLVLLVLALGAAAFYYFYPAQLK